MSQPSTTPADPFISVPLRKEYLATLWDDKRTQHEWGEVSFVVANLIKMLDPLSVYTHIEWPTDADLLEPISLPRIWRIERWLPAHERYMKVKAQSERDRIRSCTMREDIDKVRKTLQWKCALTEDNAIAMATKIVTMRATEMCEQLCGYRLRKLEGE